MTSSKRRFSVTAGGLREHARLRLALLNHALGLHLKISISLEGALKVGLLSCVRSLTLSCALCSVCFASSLGRLRSRYCSRGREG